MNKVKPVNISLTEDTQHILKDLDRVLSDIGMSRSKWFRRSAIKFVQDYDKFSQSKAIV